MMHRAFTVVFVLATLLLALPGGHTASASPAEQGMLRRPTSAAIGAARVNVAIQAGHWKSNELPDVLARLRSSTGAVGGGRSEAQVTLDIAQRAARLLRAKGLTVEILPATVPTGYEADLFISLHADGNNSTAARGYKVSTRWRSEVAAMDAVLVASLDEGYRRITGMPQNSSITRAMRGYYAYSTYRGEEYRLGGSTPAAILEMGFMSNAADRAMMFNNAELVARGVVAGIDNFYARRAEALRLQAEAERQAAASPFERSVVILTDASNIRAAANTGSRRLATADFGDSFRMMEAIRRPSGSGNFDPRRGTQVVTGSGWYKIAIPGSEGDAYISRDLVVVQQ